MPRPPPSAQRASTLFPSTTLFRSDRRHRRVAHRARGVRGRCGGFVSRERGGGAIQQPCSPRAGTRPAGGSPPAGGTLVRPGAVLLRIRARSEEHTSELQSLMRISYAVFCLKKKINQNKNSYS